MLYGFNQSPEDLNMARRKPTRGRDEIAQFKLRLPEWLRARLDRAAARNRQSMNIEMVERLGRSFQMDAAEQDAPSLTLTAELVLRSLDPRVVAKMVEILEDERAKSTSSFEDHLRRVKEDLEIGRFDETKLRNTTEMLRAGRLGHLHLRPDDPPGAESRDEAPERLAGPTGKRP
jgi:hypothetical protein